MKEGPLTESDHKLVGYARACLALDTAVGLLLLAPALSRERPVVPFWVPVALLLPLLVILVRKLAARLATRAHDEAGPPGEYYRRSAARVDDVSPEALGHRSLGSKRGVLGLYIALHLALLALGAAGIVLLGLALGFALFTCGRH